MKRICNIMKLLTCIMFLFFTMACSAEDKRDISTEPTEKYFCLEDFEDIVLDETTLFDMDERYMRGEMMVTSYGGCCDYPTEDGGYIRIKFYGPEMVVGNIEYIPAT